MNRHHPVSLRPWERLIAVTDPPNLVLIKSDDEAGILVLDGPWIAACQPVTTRLHVTTHNKNSGTIIRIGPITVTVTSAKSFLDQLNACIQDTRSRHVFLSLYHSSLPYRLHQPAPLPKIETLASRKQEYVNFEKVKFWLGTWNVNGWDPSKLDWISYDAEVIAIGLQEIEASAQAYVLQDESVSKKWIGLISTVLEDYELIQSSQLVGLLLVVYIRKETAANVHSVCSTFAACGVMGFLGNKGGVCVRFGYFDSTVSIINSHLAAMTNNVARRNLDFAELCKRLVFPDKSVALDADHVFWLGDLNYRIDLPLPQVKTSIESHDFEFLLQHDQLRREIKEKRAFQCFKEAGIVFPPTYKYDVGTCVLDTSIKGRVPAYCDRILWQSMGICPLVYESHMQIDFSDHKPLSGQYAVDIAVIDTQRERYVRTEIARQLDVYENAIVPRVVASSTDIVFDNMEFYCTETQAVEILNNGNVNGHFSVELHDSSPNSPLWCTPQVGMLEPGEAIKIYFSILVDQHSVQHIDTLVRNIAIIHVDKGKDIFITIQASFLPTCFGRSLETLAAMPNPVREENFNSNYHGSLPKEVWQMVEHLYQHGLQNPDLFLNSSSLELFLQVQHCLNTGKKLGGNQTEQSSMACAVAENLILFLHALPSPILPIENIDTIDVDDRRQVIGLLDNLSGPLANTFLCITSLVTEFFVIHNKKIIVEKVLLLFSQAFLQRYMEKVEKTRRETAKWVRYQRFFMHFFEIHPSDGTTIISE